LSQKQKFIKRLFPFIKTNNTSRGLTHYLPHPDKNQEKFIFNLMNEALEAGAIDIDYLKNQIHQSNLRPDIFQMLEKAKNEKAF
jgi:hypothetical protein